MDYLSSIDMDTLADSILLDCFHDEYEKEHKAVNIDILAGRYLGLDISYRKLSEDGHILGLTTYSDVNIELQRGGSHELVCLKKDSLVLEKALLEGSNGRRRFTVAHETAHQILFRCYGGNTILNYMTQMPDKKALSEKECHSEESRKEWQANRLGASLLMPVKSICYWMETLNYSFPLIFRNNRLDARDSRILAELLECFAVSRTAMLIRLEQLGFILNEPENALEPDVFFRLKRGGSTGS